MMEIPINEKENKIANEEGAYLYGYLRKKYANDSVQDLDIILNSLTFALLRLIHNHVGKADQSMFVDKILRAIIDKGLSK